MVVEELVLQMQPHLEVRVVEVTEGSDQQVTVLKLLLQLLPILAVEEAGEVVQILELVGKVAMAVQELYLS